MKTLSSIKKKGISILLLVGIFVLSGCGINSGLINQYSVNGANTNVILQKKNFKVIGTVTGESSDSYIFFIGGRKQNLVARAKQSMIESAKLDGTAKAIVNVTTEEHAVFKFVYMKRIITVHGTVVEFLE